MVELIYTYILADASKSFKKTDFMEMVKDYSKYLGLRPGLKNSLVEAMSAIAPKVRAPASSLGDCKANGIVDPGFTVMQAYYFGRHYMKAIIYHRCGGPEVMQLGDLPVPVPKSGQVLVRVRAASVNPVDLKMRAVLARFATRPGWPKQMGIDFAGIVEKSGPGVTGLNEGDHVFGWADFKTTGSFSEYVTASAELTVNMPDNVSFEGAACFGIAGNTVLKAFYEKGDLQPGMEILVNGCMGGVGHIAVRIAKAQGARVTGFCGDYDMEAAKQLGCDEVYDYRTTGLKDTGQSFDMILDTPGVLSFFKSLPFLKSGGLFIHLIPTPGMVGAILASLFIRKSYTVFNTLATRNRMLRLADLAAEGILKPVVGKTIPLENAVAGITALERGEKVTGKTVIVMNGD